MRHTLITSTSRAELHDLPRDHRVRLTRDDRDGAIRRAHSIRAMTRGARLVQARTVLKIRRAGEHEIELAFHRIGGERRGRSQGPRDRNRHPPHDVHGDERATDARLIAPETREWLRADAA